MPQYERFSKIEKKYYSKMIDILIEFFKESGYKDIQHTSTIRQKIDCENGVDCQFIIDGKLINVALRCRENCNYRDITIRRTASDSGLPTEIHKIKDGKYLANIYLYCWFNSIIKRTEYCIINIKKLTYDKIMDNTKDWMYNYNEDGTKDGSTFYPIGVYDIKDCIIKMKINNCDFKHSSKF